MKSVKLVSAGVLMNIILVSCGMMEPLLLETPTPTSTRTPAPTSTPAPPKIKLISYNYTLADVGEGWNEGTVRIAFENATENYISGPLLDFYGATLETAQGKTYPVELSYFGCGRVLSDL